MSATKGSRGAAIGCMQGRFDGQAVPLCPDKRGGGVYASASSAEAASFGLRLFKTIGAEKKVAERLAHAQRARAATLMLCAIVL
jgi:hypothetical protein